MTINRGLDGTMKAGECQRRFKFITKIIDEGLKDLKSVQYAGVPRKKKISSVLQILDVPTQRSDPHRHPVCNDYLIKH